MPKQLAIVKISGHSKSDSIEAKGIQLADAETKQADLSLFSPNFEYVLCSNITLMKLKKFLLQAEELASENEKQAYKRKVYILIPSHKYGSDQIRGI